jgi:hypothetical protein
MSLMSTMALLVLPEAVFLLLVEVYIRHSKEI